MGDFMDYNSEIAKHGGKLPHWQQDGRMQSVTFRLADAMPKMKLRIWKESRDNWLDHHPQPWEEDVEREYHRKFTDQLERWLDQGSGSCILRKAGNRDILGNVLMKFQGERVEHHSWVIMPNHVHLLFKPLEPMENLMKAWKGVSARLIGEGSIWQENYRDTMIRDGRHFSNAVRYIRRNPLKLGSGKFTLWESERARAVGWD